MKITQRKVWLSFAVAGMLCFGAVSGFGQKKLPDVHYEATPQLIVEEMLKMAEVTQGDIVYDLGCGDGRFVITAAKKYGARGVGIDIDPERIRESKDHARMAGVMDKVKFKQGDLFETDIQEATLVALYLLPELNLELRPKLLKELKPGSRVVSFKFDMVDWQPDKMARLGSNTYYLWVIPTDAAGKWRWSLPSAKGEEQFSLNLLQNFQEINGMLKTPFQEVSILDAYLVGAQIGFLLHYRTPEQTMEMRFSGRVSGNTINGSVEVKSGQLVNRLQWTAKRETTIPKDPKEK